MNDPIERVWSMPAVIAAGNTLESAERRGLIKDVGEPAAEILKIRDRIDRGEYRGPFPLHSPTVAVAFAACIAKGVPDLAQKLTSGLVPAMTALLQSPDKDAAMVLAASASAMAAIRADAITAIHELPSHGLDSATAQISAGGYANRFVKAGGSPEDPRLHGALAALGT
ncbi:MAG: hypothetical protein AAFX94_14690 [Myxococcota bacterium]